MKKLFTLLAVAAGMLLTYSLGAQAGLEFYINSPSSFAGQIEVGPPADNFGGNLGPGEELSGDLAVVMDSNVNDTLAQQGCDSLINGADIAGKIALIRRGECFFSDKVWFAEQAGAVGAVICNNTPGSGAITMGAGGDYAGLATIPSAFIGYDDCELIIQELGTGGSVNITMRVPAFANAIGSYSYHTPAYQVIPIDIMQVQLFNPGGEDEFNIDVTAEITDPGSNVTTYTETIEVFAANTDSTVTFPEYTPAAIGEYSVVFSNTLNTDVLESKFVITEDVFAVDDGTVSGDVGPSEAQFSTANSYKYHVGSLALTNDDLFTKATHVSFGIANAPDFFTGNPDFDILTIVLYNGDADGDDVLDWAAANASFDDLTPVALGNYIVTGTEDPAAMIMVDLLPTTPGELTVDLQPNGAYYPSIQYNGDPVDAIIAPRFLSTDDVNYVNFPTTPLFLDILYSGWSGEIVVCRLHTDNTVGTNDLPLLDSDKISLSPNPASSVVNLGLDLTELADEVRVDILNYDGKVVHSQTLENVQNDSYEFDVTKFANGYYFMSVKTPEGWRSVSFVVSK